jgi:mannitol-specific phosphotransferase system IIBC component
LIAKKPNKIKNPNLHDTTMLGHKVKPLRQNTDYIVAAAIAESRLIISSTRVQLISVHSNLESNEWKVRNLK